MAFEFLMIKVINVSRRYNHGPKNEALKE